MAESGSESGKKEPGIYTEKVADVPIEKMNRESFERLGKIPGVEAQVDADSGKVKITLNSIVLPKKK